MMDYYMRTAIAFCLLSLTTASLPWDYGFCSQIYTMHRYCTTQMSPTSTGVTGNAGPVGPPGPPGIVNYTAIEEEIVAKKHDLENGIDEKIERFEKMVNEKQERCNVEIEKLRNETEKKNDLLKKKDAEMETKIEKMERDAKECLGTTENVTKQYDLLKKKIAEMETKIEGRGIEGDAEGNVTKLPCTNGMIYGDKCFVAEIKSEVNYDGGVAVCKNLGGHLANIYRQSHMEDVMKYIRANRWDGFAHMYFRLGMKYDPRGKKLTLRDGTDASADLKWHQGLPYTVEANGEPYADRTNVLVSVVNDDQSSINQYLVNAPPQWESYALCEIE